MTNRKQAATNRTGCFRHGAALLLVFLILGAAAPRASSAPREDGAFFPPPPRNHVTFWGHACCYIDVDGFGIVTDPVFAGRYGFRRRKIPVPPAESRAGTRLILVSHAHMDHLNTGTLDMFPDSAIVLCPSTVARYLEGGIRRYRIMSPGDTWTYPHGKIVAVAADHPGGRYSLRKKTPGGALGFVITTPYGNIYYSGDTEYFDGLVEIGSAWRPRIAILNITPHLSGDDAVRAAWATRAPVVIPVHFGAYDYLLLGPRRSPRGYDGIERLLGDRAVLLQPGESISIDGNPSADGPVRNRKDALKGRD